MPTEKKDRYSRITVDSKGNIRDAWNRYMTGYKVVQQYKSNIKTTRKLVSKNELDYLLANNVCELYITRRRPERAAPGKFMIRRMLCTNNIALLTSDKAKMANFQFRPPKGAGKIDLVKHDLCCAWDIFMKDYRNISISTPESPHTGKGASVMSCYLRQVIPANETFWAYYNEHMANISEEDRLGWLGWR